MKRVRLHLLNLIVTSMTLLACDQEIPLDPNRVDVYNHRYDNLQISNIESQYSKDNYKDYSRYSMYTYYGYPMSYSPSINTAKFLVVPVWFNDSTEYIAYDHRENVRDDIRKAYFGTEEETGWESVKTYYEKDSFGRLEIDGLVTEWYETGLSSVQFYTNYGSTESLLYSIGAWAKDNIEDYASFDCDKDGFIDGLVLIYGCYDQYGLYYEKQQQNTGNMWAYTSRLVDRSQYNLRNPGINDFFWASYDFMYGSYTESQRNFTFSRTGMGTFGNGDVSNCIIDSHTFVHETGHLFGLNDYYDYNMVASPGLGFSMQDENVGGHDPFSRFALGWAKAIVPTETCRVHVKPMEDEGEFILLSPDFNGSAFNEYLAVELFTATGLNKSDCEVTYDGRAHPNIKYGVRLWHVDSRLFKVEKMNMYTGRISKGHIVEDISEGYVTEATSNTTYVEGYGDRAINLAGSYDYKELQVIRNGYRMYDENGELISSTSRRSPYIVDSDFFQTGDYFTVHNYRSQFVEEEALNSGNELGWSIYFDEVSESGMTVTCIKEFLKK